MPEEEEDHSLRRVVVGEEQSYPPEKKAHELHNTYALNTNQTDDKHARQHDDDKYNARARQIDAPPAIPTAPPYQYEEKDADKTIATHGHDKSTPHRRNTNMRKRTTTKTTPSAASSLGKDVGKLVKKLVLTVLALLYVIYFIAVLAIPSEVEKTDYWCHGDGFLVLLTIVVGLGIFYYQVLKVRWGDYLYENVILFLGALFSKVWRHR
ncbi:hypothetical protein GWK47_041823 [Chionoecetes opilio]|uniref:Uncharacterized protein n=1 Tax=Chionoecetes opilio TaxID=41210 RepID=A0A8J5CZ97_CHIOP|nr:hypothetical protein GWK47_041823 [Chionoecetes opilio]